MKAVFVLFDSLNRKSLEAYGARTVKTPHFKRLAERTATFDRHYVGSLPCMPARRDMQTGRLSFLHRSWGPLEPYDNAFPELMHQAGVYSHLITDHYHYWEDGGATYHNRYDTYEFIRGQERDPWKAMVEPPWERLRDMYHKLQYNESRRNKFYHYIINREFIKEEEDFPSVQCFKAGFEFLDRNRTADNWFLQIETFDPHEPFFSPKRFRDDYPTNYAGPILDWPPYARVNEAPDECAELRANYCAIVALCDDLMGRLIYYFDRHDLWRDTALIVSTDHGFLLGEHDWWAKNRMPVYEEVSHIPLFIHHPAMPSEAGGRRRALTQTIDLMATFLDLYGIAPPAEVEGKSLLPVVGRDQELREAALFGVFGSATNLTDGRYTYFRYPDDVLDQELYQYTLMPTHLAAFFTPDELRTATLAPPFPFTKGVPLLKVPTIPKSPMFMMYGPGVLADTGTVLYDLAKDPLQATPIGDPAVEARLARAMARLMAKNDAPPEAFRRLKLDAA
ncbi:MAG: sulfatase [Proteobacteria bacterium]|nr:sulfatase [Pseudomonadota bacterium]